MRPATAIADGSSVPDAQPPAAVAHPPRVNQPGHIRRSIAWIGHSMSAKVFVLLLLQALIVVLAFSLLVFWAFDEGFSQYTNANADQRARVMARDLEAEFALTGDWTALKSRPRRWAQLAMSAAGHSVGDLDQLEALFSQFKGSEFPANIPAPLPMRFVLFDTSGTLLIGSPPADASFRRHEIVSNGVVVGELGVVLNRPTQYDLQFRERFLTVLLVIIGVCVLLSTLPAMLITRFVTQPLRTLGRAARSLAKGHAVKPLAVASSDELGDLASDFNVLSSTLQSNQELQRQWLADISHELRTPVAILMAETEAVIDGLREPSLAGVRSLHEETRRLSLLIDDLHHLSLLECGATRMHLAEVNVGEILHTCIAAEQTRFDGCRIAMRVDVREPQMLGMVGDFEQLRRVFMNLMENTLRYTDAGGELRILAENCSGAVRIVFDDSSPGVSEAEIPRLFDRLYRGESSRNRASGGAGLGLAIVQSVVAAHGGSIVASQSDLGGLRFEMRFRGITR